MFSIFRKKVRPRIDFSRLRCDMHSHLIPGIDDGATDIEVSLQMIRGMVDLGYKKLITTPHIQWEMYQNTHETILAGGQLVKDRIEQHNIPVDFVAAAEYFMDDHFDELLKNNVPLLTIKDNLVLIEFSFIRQPMDLKEKIFKMFIQGYQPIIAHPERYLFFGGSHKHWYDDLKEMGCYFQLNILSLCGYYGKKQEELADYLIKKKYVNLLGTDMHNYRHVQILKASSTIMETVNRLLDADVLINPHL